MRHIYTKEQLKAMTADEVTRAITEDLYEDAYATQKAQPVPYRGRKPAELLETALYVCPRCKGLCTTHSEGDLFFCDCGLSVRYNEYGFFEGCERHFDTVTEWDVWQESYLRKLAENQDDAPIFSDEGQSLWRVENDHAEHLAAEGTMTLYRDKLVLGALELPLQQISQMSLYGRETIVFSAAGVNYEVKSAHSRSGRKYITMYDILMNISETKRKAQTCD